MAAVTVLGLAATTLVFWRAKAKAEQATSQEFGRIVSEAALRLEGQLHGFEEALHASAGYVMGSEDITTPEWERFEARVRLPHLLPGASALVFLEQTPGSRPGEMVYRVIDSEFALRTSTPLATAEARDVLRRACASREIAALVEPVPGDSALALALIRRVLRSTSRDSAADCGSNLRGFVFLELHPEALVRAVLEDGQDDAAFDLLTALPPAAPASATPRQVRTIPVRFAGRTWWLRGASLPNFESSHAYHAPRYHLLAGLIFTLLAAALAGSEVDRRRLEAESRRAMERTLARTETALGQSTARSLEAEQRISALIDSALDAILSLDENGLVVTLNPAAERMLRCRADDVVGQPLARFLPERMRNRYTSTIADFAHGARHRVIGGDEELIACRFDGEEFPIEATLSLSEQEGRRQYVLIVRDLSERRAIEQERKTLEAQLRQSQKMEAIGTLAGGIAHDFNNLLGSILGNAEMATEELPSEHPAREFIGEVVCAGERARDLVRRILGFTRQQEQERKPVRLDSTASEAVRLLRATLPARIELITEFHESLPTVLADAGQIHQVLVNLITNSAHAIGNDAGRIRVVLRSHAAGTDPALPKALNACECLELAVIDNGCGMSPSVLERIFDPFFTTKPVGQGTGLGLSVAHGIVQQHEGIIRATSRPGIGTTVQVLLPALDEEPAAAAPSTNGFPRGNGECVLLVDDEAALRTMGERVLKRLGYTSLVAGGAAEALRILEDGHPIHILLTDLSMPGLSGTDLAERALRLHPHLPIVLLTGYGLAASPDNLKERGIRAVLPKPVALRALAETLAAVSGGHAKNSGG